MMEGVRWVGYADQDAREEVEAALVHAGFDGSVTFLDSPEQLRASVALDGQGRANVVVGRASGGVSDINLAAAVVGDRQANQVVLVRNKASGSLRSRAHRAGITDVIDSSELRSGELLVRERGTGVSCDADGGPTQAPAPARAPALPGEVMIASHPERVRASGAPVLVFCSGRGGCGKSAVSVAAAAVAASWGMDVGIVDMDLSCGNAYSYLGLPSGCDLAGLVSGAGGFVLSHGVSAGEHMRMWGPCELPEAAELVMPHAREVVSAAAAECDLVIVDTSTTFTDAVAQMAQMCDRLVLVSDDRPGSLSALSRTAGLAVRLGVARTRIVRITNRADPRAKADLVLGRAEVGLETARIYRVFESDELFDLLSMGQGASIPFVDSAFTESVAHFLAQTLSEMGRLPDCKAALQALKTDGSLQGWGPFARKREVG